MNANTELGPLVRSETRRRDPSGELHLDRLQSSRQTQNYDNAVEPLATFATQLEDEAVAILREYMGGVDEGVAWSPELWSTLQLSSGPVRAVIKWEKSVLDVDTNRWRTDYRAAPNLKFQMGHRLARIKYGPSRRPDSDRNTTSPQTRWALRSNTEPPADRRQIAGDRWSLEIRLETL